MKIENNQNYTIISNHLDAKFLTNFVDYTIYSENISFAQLTNIIYNYPAKTIVFNDILRQFNTSEKDTIFSLLNKRGVNFINITSDIEEALFADYLIVFWDYEIAIEGQTLDVLQEEKLLKRMGFALPFTIDLSLQLKLYGVIDHIEPDLRKLVDTIWN